MAVTQEALPPRSPAARLHPQAVVSARDLVKTYGSGDAAVHALAGVDLDVAPARFTAIMGPSGSGKSTLMHCMAGLDTLDLGLGAGRRRRPRPPLRPQAHPAAARSPRLRVPVVQPRADAQRRREHRTADACSPVASVDRRWFDKVVARSDSATGCVTARPSSPAASSSASPSPGRSSAGRTIVFADEPTGNLDSRAGAEVLGFLRRRGRHLGQTIVMVTHDPNAASYADEVVFLADGRVVDLMPAPTTDRVLDRMKAFGG